MYVCREISRKNSGADRTGDVQVSIADIPYRSSFASVFDKSPEVGIMNCGHCLLL